MAQQTKANAFLFPVAELYRAALSYLAFFVFYPPLLSNVLHRMRGVRFEKWQSNYIAFNVLLDTNFPELIYIKEGAWLTREVKILTHFTPTPMLREFIGSTKTGPVEIGRGAFIGVGATILPNVTIGDYAIVGAGSVVTKSVAPRTFVAGNPARIIRTI